MFALRPLFPDTAEWRFNEGWKIGLNASVSKGHEASGVHSRWGSRGSTVGGVMYFT